MYLLPSIIGFKRKHQNTAGIVTVNLSPGWTFLGWIAALVWSVTATTKAA
jgi:Superinfection immunity protein